MGLVMNFNTAFHELETGEVDMIWRDDWDKGQWVKIGYSRTSVPHLYSNRRATALNMSIPWLPSQEDLFAKNWKGRVIPKEQTDKYCDNTSVIDSNDQTSAINSLSNRINILEESLHKINQAVSRAWHRIEKIEVGMND